MRHDAHYKRLFGHPRMTGDLLELLRARLSGRFPILRQIQPDTLRRLPTELVSDDLRPRFADLVWKVRLAGPAGTRRGVAPSPGDAPGGRWLHLVVLLEFQSAVDWMMAARVQDYAARLWLDMHCRESFGPSRAPPPIFPVVVYNGDRTWNAPTRAADLWRPEAVTMDVAGKDNTEDAGEDAGQGGVNARPLRLCGDGFALLDLQALGGAVCRRITASRGSRGSNPLEATGNCSRRLMVCSGGWTMPPMVRWARRSWIGCGR